MLNLFMAVEATRRSYGLEQRGITQMELLRREVDEEGRQAAAHHQNQFTVFPDPSLATALQDVVEHWGEVGNASRDRVILSEGVVVLKRNGSSAVAVVDTRDPLNPSVTFPLSGELDRHTFMNAVERVVTMGSVSAMRFAQERRDLQIAAVAASAR